MLLCREGWEAKMVIEKGCKARPTGIYSQRPSILQFRSEWGLDVSEGSKRKCVMAFGSRGK